jgi:hypothetical protein
MDPDENSNLEKLVEEMFKPLTPERLDHILALSTDLDDLSQHPELSVSDSATIELAANQLLILSSMAVAGQSLYHEYWGAAQALYEEARFNQMMIGTNDRSTAESMRTDALRRYEELRETDPNEILERSEWPDA